MTERHHQVNRWLNPIHFKQSSTFWQTIGESRGPAVAIHVSLSTIMVGSLQSGRPDKISIHHFKNAACPSAVTWDRLAHLWTNNPPVWPVSRVLGLPCSRIFLASQNHYSQTSFQNPESKMQQRRVQWKKYTTHRRWNAQLEVQSGYCGACLRPQFSLISPPGMVWEQVVKWRRLGGRQVQIGDSIVCRGDNASPSIHPPTFPHVPPRVSLTLSSPSTLGRILPRGSDWAALHHLHSTLDHTNVGKLVLSAGSKSIAKLGYPIDYDDQDLSYFDFQKYLHL